MSDKLSDVLQDSERSRQLRSFLIAWHGFLQENRGERARMRREKSPLDVYVSEAFRRGVVQRLDSNGFKFGEKDLERLAVAVGLLSHVKNLDNSKHFAALLAGSEKGAPDAKDVRFRKLLSVDDDDREALYMTLLRLIKLMGGKAGLTGLLEGACFWSDYSRRRWAEEYYSVKRN